MSCVGMLCKGPLPAYTSITPLGDDLPCCLKSVKSPHHRFQHLTCKKAELADSVLEIAPSGVRVTSGRFTPSCVSTDLSGTLATGRHRVRGLLFCLGV